MVLFALLVDQNSTPAKGHSPHSLPGHSLPPLQLCCNQGKQEVH